MKQQNKYEKLFDEFLDLAEFRLVRHQNGYDEYADEYGHWSLIDNQGANLGDIEGLIEYCRDKLPEKQWELDVLDMICNHFDEINLENCFYDED